MKKFIIAVITALTLCFSALKSEAGNIKSTDNSSVEIFYDGAQDFIARFTLKPDWHIYWKNPGEIGLPTLTKVSDADLHILNQSVPQVRMAYDIMREYIYEQTAYFSLRITNASPQAELIFEFVECNDECKPEKLSFPLSEIRPTEKTLWEQIVSAADRTFPQTLETDILPPYNDINLPLSAHGEIFFIPSTRDLIDESQINITDKNNNLRIHWQNNTEQPLQEALLITPEKPYLLKINYKDTSWKTLLYIIFLAFLGGIILNAMPCVFPILSLKIFSLLKSRRRPFKPYLAALSYTCGVLFSFLILTACLIWLKKHGESAGWGFQLQSPWFVGIMAAIFLIMFLFMIDLLHFPNIARQKLHKAAALINFTTGFFAVLIASPCTGPFMGAAIGYALLLQPLQIFLVFTSLALGYALPYALIEMFPQTLRRVLPKPGHWMHTLKIILSIPILLTFFWLSSVLYIQLSHCSATDTTASELVWQPYDARQIAELNTQKENIFVDFTADWCLTCKFNHAVMINTKRFKNFVKKNHVHLFMADLTEDNEIYNAALNYYGRDSIPLYIYYKNGNYRILPLFFSIKSLEED